MAGKIYETGIVLRAALDSRFKSVTGGAAGALKKLEKEAKKLSKAKEAAAAFQKLQTELKQAESALAAAGGESKKLKAAVERKALAVAKASGRLQKLGVDTARLSSEEGRLSRQLRGVELRMRGVSLVAGAQLGKRLQSLRNATVSLARATARWGAVAGVAVGATVVKFAQFEKGMKEVSTLVDTSKVDIPELAKQVRALSKEYGADHVVQAKALYQTISGGITNANDAMTVLNVANKLAVAGVTDVETSVNGLTTVLNSFGIGASGAAHASDVLLRTMAMAKTTIPELAENLFKAVPDAANLGLKLEEVSAAVVGLTLAGTPTTVAMDRVRAAMVALVKPTPKMTALWKKLGHANGQAALQALGFKGALDAVFKAGKGNLGNIALLMGRIEGASAAALLAGKASDKYTEALDSLENASGDTDVAFNKMRTSLAFQASEIKAKATDVMITIGSKLAPIVGRAFEKISAWLKQNEANIERWATIAAEWIEGKLIPTLLDFAKNTIPAIREGIASILPELKELAGALPPILNALAKVASFTVKAVTPLVSEQSRIDAVNRFRAKEGLGPIGGAAPAAPGAGAAPAPGSPSFAEWVQRQDARQQGVQVNATVAPTINVTGIDEAKKAIRESSEEAVKQLDRQTEQVERARRRRALG